jgi:histidinol-phosphate/aromatic aminotransferase/cobyric acid decarboxylase-like protein/imidazoleglycerol phosphate dehydratase HisB
MTLLAPVEAYGGPEASEDIASRFGMRREAVLRFDGNTPPLPLGYASPVAVAQPLSRVNEYDHTRGQELVEAIAAYCDAAPANIVLGAGGDDLLALIARSFLRPGDTAAIEPDRTYPMYRIAVGWTGATLSAEAPRLTFVCRPNNPTGELTELPAARPLVVDEAYAEYAGESAVGLIEDDVIVVRTFSKRFGLAGARIGYAVANEEIAARLNERQSPYAVSSISVALALAALRDPPDVTPTLVERERLASSLRELGLSPLESWTNFVFVPVGDACALAEKLKERGLVVRAYEDGIRISVRDAYDDDLLLAALGELLGRRSHGEKVPGTVRHCRATAETVVHVRLARSEERSSYVHTGCGFADHLLQQLTFHAGINTRIEGGGDLETGDHHTAEDATRAFGEALRKLLGTRAGLRRYGEAALPMDEAFARVAIDLSGRPVSQVSLEGDCETAAHMLECLAQSARLTLHARVTGSNSHHIAEAAFKAAGRALAMAMQCDGESERVLSTKGVL